MGLRAIRICLTRPEIFKTIEAVGYCDKGDDDDQHDYECHYNLLLEVDL